MRWFFETKAQAEARQKRKQEIAEARSLRDDLKREGDYYASKFPYWLAQMGIDHRLAARLQPSLAAELILGKSGRQMIEILEVDVEPSAIYLRIDTQNMPYLAKLKDLYDPEVLETLSDQSDRQVLYRSIPGNGTWYIVVRDGAINAIPKVFPFTEAIKQLPENAAPLCFIVGETENRRVISADLAKLPHYLIAGATFTGKSVHLNYIICQLLSRNPTPDLLQFLMVDLKGQSELGLYEGIPHLRWPIVGKPEQVVPALKAFKDLMTERIEKYARHHIKNIEGWNHQHPLEKDSYVVLIFDEVGEVLAHPDRKMAKEAELYLESLMATCRAGGGHVIISTQRPSADVIRPWITSNASTRICFAVASQPNSILVVGKGSAAGLKPAGRAMYLNGPDLIELQTPLVEDLQIARIVKEVTTGQREETQISPDRELGLQEILEEAVDNYGGSLAEKPLYQSFRGKIPRDKIRALVGSLNGDPIIIHGKAYRVVEKHHGITRTRILEEVPRALPDLQARSPKLSHELFPRGRARGDPSSDS